MIFGGGFGHEKHMLEFLNYFSKKVQIINFQIKFTPVKNIGRLRHRNFLKMCLKSRHPLSINWPPQKKLDNGFQYLSDGTFHKPYQKYDFDIK